MLFIFIWGLCFLAVPESFLAGYLQRSMAGLGIALELTGFEKGFFYTLHVERASLNKCSPHSNRLPASSPVESSGARPAFVVLQNLDISPDMLSFLKLSPRFNFRGQIGQGSMRGSAGREQGGLIAAVHGEHIDVSSLPILIQAGVYGEGSLEFDFRWKKSRGELVFSVDDARLSGIFSGNSAIPLNFFKSMRGVLALGNTITVNSLVPEGQGVYVRVKGEIREGGFDGRAEIMADASFPQYPLFKSFLERYTVSPGYYVIPFSHAALPSRVQPEVD